MKNILLLSILIFTWNAQAALLPYMKVECRDVEGMFGAKDMVLVFDLQETKTGQLQYSDISTNKNGKIGFYGSYTTDFYKSKPDGSWGELANEGRLKLISKSTNAELIMTNCRELK